MKKKIAIILALTLLVGILAGCAPASNEELTIHIVYPVSKDEVAKDELSAEVSKEFTKPEKASEDPTEETIAEMLTEKYHLSTKEYFCEDKNYSAKLAEAVGANVDIVICVGDVFSDIVGVSASNPKVRWIWVGGDEALATDKIFVADSASALRNKLTEYIEHDLSKDYVWSDATAATVFTEETAG